MATYIGYFYFMQIFMSLCMTLNSACHFSYYVSSTSKVGQGGMTSTFRSQYVSNFALAFQSRQVLTVD